MAFDPNRRTKEPGGAAGRRRSHPGTSNPEVAPDHLLSHSPSAPPPSPPAACAFRGSPPAAPPRPDRPLAGPGPHVLTPPDTTTTSTSTRSRPRRWPSNADTAVRRRSVGHGDVHMPTAAPLSLSSPIDTDVEAPAARRSAHVLPRAHLTTLDRARLALVAALFAAATAGAAIPANNDPVRATTERLTMPAVTPAAVTAPCSPVAVDCCRGTISPVDIVRELRPVCP